MRIAFIAQRMVYPPDAGTPIRNFNLALQAARRHDLSVYGFTDPELEPDPLREAGADLHLLATPAARGRGQRLRELFSSTEPDMARRSYSDSLLRLLADDLPRARPDVVQIQALDMAYVLPTVRAAVPDAQVMLDQHNAEYLLQRRALAIDLTRPRRWPIAAYSAWQSALLRRYERRMCRACDTVLAVSEEDRDALRCLGIGTAIDVVPNGVDLSAYESVAPEPRLAGAAGPQFVFPGKMDFRPNVDAATWFAQAVLPLVRRRHPEAGFWVVGRDPSAAVTALSRLPNVHVTGPVRDARPFIAAATAVVVPLRMGAGTKLKVLEAAALRRPLVLTTVAAEGYPIVNDRDAIIADTADQLATACLRVANNPGQGEVLGKNAYLNLATPLEWSRVYERLEAAYARSGSD